MSAVPRCVVNPAVYQEQFGQMPPECPPSPSNVTRHVELAYPRHAFLLSLPSKLDAYHQRRDFLDSFGIKLERWPAVNGSATWSASDYSKRVRADGQEEDVWLDRARNVTVARGSEGFLTLGERGYLESMRRLFRHALARPEIHNMLVLDEDVVFDCSLRERLEAVLRSARCGSVVASDVTRGGVLLLGVAIWVAGSSTDLRGWALTLADLAQTAAPMCFNAHAKTFGSFATIYHRSSFSPIYTWIKTARRPFDHVFRHLASLQMPVRVAYPFVAIQDVQHDSTVDNRGVRQSDMLERARIHRWQVCGPSTVPRLTHRSSTATAAPTLRRCCSCPSFHHAWSVVPNPTGSRLEELARNGLDLGQEVFGLDGHAGLVERVQQHLDVELVHVLEEVLDGVDDEPAIDTEIRRFKRCIKRLRAKQKAACCLGIHQSRHECA